MLSVDPVLYMVKIKLFDKNLKLSIYFKGWK